MASIPPTHHLGIGEIILSGDPIVVSTVLGSCVSVCLFSPEKQAGGIIHYALPRAPLAYKQEDAFRYGELAIKALITELQKHTGLSAREFQAKIVGGANEPQAMGVGKENIEIAQKLLKKYNIPVVGESVGGDNGRKILFHIPSGRLQVAPVKDILASTFAKPTAASAKSTSVAKNASVVPLAKAPAQAKKEDKKPSGPRKVLIIDDSKTICNLLTKILSADPRFKVVGDAPNPIVAEKMIKELKPDVLTLDIHMPEMDGVTFLEKFLPTNPMPVVMVSSVSLEDGGLVLKALELGAVDYIQKPHFSDLQNQQELIREKVFTGSFAKVKSQRRHIVTPNRNIQRVPLALDQLIAIGASTGGTEALKDVLTQLPEEIPPIVIVQHIPPVFSLAFANRLNELCRFEVKEAEDGDEVRPSLALIAPGGKQMKLEQSGRGLFVKITDDAPVNRHKPSVDYLFHSVAAIMGKKALGVILTGMGGDGAKGLLDMRSKGSRTIGQDEESCAVYGMPKVAFDIGAVEQVASLSNIPELILEALAKKKAA